MSSLLSQIKKARKRVRYLKRVTPEIFPEWHRLQNAKSAVIAAQEQLSAAKRTWKNLGNEHD